MRFPPSLLDEIRARLHVSDVVGRRVKLRRQGREHVGLSPFNAEKTPSFTVNDQKGFYHCFSSGKHGDIFRFVMETEGLTFPEAVERLAGEAGVPLPAPDPHAQERESAATGLRAACEAAAAFFEQQLSGQPGREARAYLERRGVSETVRTRFRLGYAPASRTALRDHLAARGISAEVMTQAGLIIAGPDIAVPYDRFRNRLIFPITDLRERVVAFGGRALEGDQQPKYLNSPETELFRKGQVLFNLAAARRAAHDAGTLIVAEGYMDVIALSQAGFANAVAPLGTALTEDQLALVWRIADEPVMCFDGDGAGLRAAYRAADLALAGLQPGRSLRFALLPQGRDPDDVIRAEGASAMRDILDAARPLVDMVWTREVESGSLDTPERRAAFETRLAATIGRIGDARVRRHYGEAMRARLDVQFDRRGFGTGGGRASRPGEAGRAPRGRRERGTPVLMRAVASTQVRRAVAAGSGFARREAILLLALIHHPDLLSERAEAVATLELATADFKRLRAVLLDCAAEGADSEDAVRARILSAGLGALLHRIEGLWAASGKAEWWVGGDAAGTDAAFAWDHTAALHHKKVTLHKELKAAERALEEDPSEANLARLFDIHAQLANADGTEALVEGFGHASGRSSRPF